MSPNIGNLLNGVLILNLLNNPFASCLLINLDFLLLHIAHFDNIISLPLLKLVDLCFLYIFYTLSSMIPFLYANTHMSQSKYYFHFHLLFCISSFRMSFSFEIMVNSS